MFICTSFLKMTDTKPPKILTFPLESPCMWLYVCRNRNISRSYSITLCMAVSTNRHIVLSSWITLYVAVSINRDIALSSWIALYVAVSTNHDIALSSWINLHVAVSTNHDIALSSWITLCMAVCMFKSIYRPFLLNHSVYGSNYKSRPLSVHFCQTSS